MLTHYTGYQQIITVLESNGVDPVTRNGEVLTTVPAVGSQFGTLQVNKAAPPFFTMHHQKGVGTGQLEIKRSLFHSDYATCPIAKNNFVVFSPEEGVEWARLRVANTPAATPYSWVIDLVGESWALQGRPATWVDDFGLWTHTFNPATGIGVYKGNAKEPYPIAFYNMKAGAIVELILNKSLSYYDSAGAWPMWWHGHRRIDSGLGDVIQSFRIDQGVMCSEAMQDLACLSPETVGVPTVWGVGNGYWGGFDAGTSGEGRAFFFGQRPGDVHMVYSRSSRSVQSAFVGNGLSEAIILNTPGKRPAPFFNACEVTYGDNFRVFQQDGTSIANNLGYIRFARETIPTIRDAVTATRYAQDYLAKFADPGPIYDPIQLEIPNANDLVVPWGGTCEIQSDGADNGSRVTIRDVKVTFGAKPIAEISLGDVEG